MKKLIAAAIVIVFLAGVACGGAAPRPEAVTATPAVKAPGQAPAREQKWQAMVSEAGKEGKVIVYAGWVPEVRTAIGAAFKDKYGVEVEFFPLGRGAELLAKVQAERRAGLAVADVLSSGATTIITGLKPGGLLAPFEPSLVLPEVTDPGAWRMGQVPFVDKDRMGINMIGALQQMVARNTDLVREGEITVFSDLLKPQFKGKITMNDPSVTGIGNSFFNHLVVDVMGLDGASDFLAKLMKQEPVVVRDSRMHVESTAKGKFAIALGTQADILASFLEMGAPITPVRMKEGTRVSSGVFSLSLPAVSSHPAAQTVFLNWLLSREGQTVMTRASRLPSMRMDVPTEGIHPIYLPVPGEKLFPDTEEWQKNAAKMTEVARKILQAK
ncbi:MAG: extracellular solute-binding protein [Chloroflexi bacterium]|nr:extracellular solute-binding protein [Chloroflexota bacterium]